MITKEDFFTKYNITEESFQAAEISWEELCLIYDDYSVNKFVKYEKILEDFTNTYLKPLSRGNSTENKNKEEVKVHSIRSRVKNAEHLLEKIIRKKQRNETKYRKLDNVNYEKFITDIIGIRCLILFKEDWKGIHEYITSNFENNPKYYIRDSVQDFDEDEKHYYIAEEPKVHIRDGDSRKIYEDILSPDHIIDGRDYRSVHYIIKYKGIYLEIQVRTLFEEGWGEIDHTIVYPYYKKDPVLEEYTQLLNRLSGLADEMGGFFYKIKQLEIEHLANQKERETLEEKDEHVRDKTEISLQKEQRMQEYVDKVITPESCLQAVLNE